MIPEILASNLMQHGISRPLSISHNPGYDELFEAETSAQRSGFEVGRLTSLGAVAVDTGVFTGRSPKDKYFVKDATTKDTVWWSDQGRNDNKAISTETWGQLKAVVGQQLSGKHLYIDDL